MHVPRTAGRLATAVFLLASTSAQTVQESISFGHSQKIAPDGQTIPNWYYVGEGHTPYLLSDRINLTPPVLGNTRGGLWAEKELTVPEWTLDLSFRVSGPERGNGNMQVWLTKDTAPASSMKSLYTVDKFDGLVIVLDQYQGTGGSIRGFLNDGSIDFRTHHNVDGLAFGHCEYVYRNLGRMSKLSMKHDSQGLEVRIDDKLCFKSSMINIPSGYYFGVSAASPETPDSFELNKLIVSTPGTPAAPASQETPNKPPNDPPAAPVNPGSNEPALPEQGKIDYAAFLKGKNPDGQYYELLNRMQSATHSINNVYRELVAVEKRLHDRHDEQATKEPSPIFPISQFNLMDERLTRIERIILAIQSDVEGRDYKEHLTSLQQSVREAQTTLLDNLPQSISQIVKTSAPRMGMFIFVVIAFQVMLVGAYIIYKKRRANSPKKFL